MKRIEIIATEQTPAVVLDSAQGVFIIEGCSFPDTPIIFYEELVQWFREYAKDPNEQTNLVCAFLYVNSTSIKFIHDILKSMDTILAGGKKASVTWIINPDDEDIEQLGQELKGLHQVPFRIVPNSEDPKPEPPKKFF